MQLQSELSPCLANDSLRRAASSAWVQAIAFALAYAAAAWVGYAISFKPGNFATFWPPSGVLVGALLLAERRKWWWLIAAASVGNLGFNNLAVGTPFLACVAFTAGNALEAIAAAVLVQRVCGPRISLTTARQVVVYTLIAGGLAPVLSAACGAATVVVAFDAAFASSFVTWWVADAIGVIVVGPLVIALCSENSRARYRSLRPHLLEGIALAASAVIVAIGAVLIAALVLYDPLIGVKFVVFPWLVWAALRFGMAGTSIACAAIALATTATASQVVHPDPNALPLVMVNTVLQGFLAVVCVSAQILAAVVEEWQGEYRERTRFRVALENAADAMFIIDATVRRVIDANVRACRLLGYERDELIGCSPVQYLPGIDEAGLTRMFASLDADVSAPPHTLTRRYRRKDGSELLVEATMQLVVSQSDRIVVVVSRDITEREAARAETSRALREKTVLLNEVHHRVKNNLQVIVSLLSLQASRTSVPAARRILADSERRVRAMALIHQLLYERLDLSRVHLGQYLAQLAELIAGSHADSSERIVLATAGLATEVHLNLERAVPCGLLVNELLTNAYKHAFPDVGHGRIRLELVRDGDSVVVSVEDNGVGLPEDLVARESSSLGLTLITLLAEQMNARILRSTPSGTGTRTDIQFEVVDGVKA